MHNQSNANTAYTQPYSAYIDSSVPTRPQHYARPAAYVVPALTAHDLLQYRPHTVIDQRVDTSTGWPHQRVEGDTRANSSFGGQWKRVPNYWREYKQQRKKYMGIRIASDPDSLPCVILHEGASRYNNAKIDYESVEVNVDTVSVS